MSSLNGSRRHVPACPASLIKVAFKLTFICFGSVNTHPIESRGSLCFTTEFPPKTQFRSRLHHPLPAAGLAPRANRRGEPVRFGPLALIICRVGECEVEKDRRHISPVSLTGVLEPSLNF